MLARVGTKATTVPTTPQPTIQPAMQPTMQSAMQPPLFQLPAIGTAPQSLQLTATSFMPTVAANSMPPYQIQPQHPIQPI